MTPTVSVLLPVFDAETTLEPCLESVARQSEPSFEVLLVDDGSTDGTAAIAHRFAARDPRFRLLRRAHEGLVAALNAGLAEARGEIVARMDGDDLMHRHRLREQVRALADPRLSGVGCRVRLFPRAHLREGLRDYEAWLNHIGSPASVRREAFVECPIAHPSLAVRREVLQAFGYRDMGWPEDYDLVLRLLGAGHELAVVPQRLLCWRDHPGRLSRTDDAYAIARFMECRASFLAAHVVTGPTYVLWGFGHTGKALRRALAHHGKSPAAIVELHPGRLGQRIHGAPVIAPRQLQRERPRGPILVSVAGAGPRAEIRAALAAMRFEELRDFVICA